MAATTSNKLLLHALAALLSYGSDAAAAMRYVAPNQQLAQDAGEGTRERPYRTLAYAMQRLQPGDTLTVAAGIYREALVFPKRAWSDDKPTTISGEGNVTLVGTDVVNGWVEQGPGIFVKRAWAKEPQQVLFNGKPLKQIGGTVFDGYPERNDHPLKGLHREQGGIWPGRSAGGRDDMPPDSFFYDAARQELLIRKNLRRLPDGTVQVATRPFLVQGQDIAGVTLSNLHFRYSSTSTASRLGAIALIGHGNTLQKLVIEDMDGAGIVLEGDDNVIADCVVKRAGQVGIKAFGRRNRIVRNHISNNNTRGFNKWWEAGGMKFMGGDGMHDALVADNVVTHNHGDGIWFDWGNDGNRVQRNVVAYNDGFGIQYEASSRGLITDNQAFANRQRGIYLLHSHDSVIAHNLVVGNGLEGIAIIDVGRSDPEGKLDLRSHHNAVLANIIGWNKGLALILPGEQFPNISDANLFLQDQDSPYFSMGWPKQWTAKNKLERWRKTQAQDRNSITVAAAMDRHVAQALAREDSRPDWSSLTGFQTMLSVPVQKLNAALLSNQILSDKAGPR